MKKENLIKTLFQWFAADDETDMDTFMVAMEAVMNHWFTPWKDQWETSAPALFNTTRDYFENEVNTVGMSKNFEAFAELCEDCIDFSFLGKIHKSQPVF